MGNYKKARVRLRNTQLNKLKSAAKDNKKNSKMINCPMNYFQQEDKKLK